MRFLRMMVLSCLCGMLALAGVARAETTVELKKVHICCGNCVKAIGGILEKVDGVKGTCDQKAKTVTITATDAWGNTYVGFNGPVTLTSSDGQLAPVNVQLTNATGTARVTFTKAGTIKLTAMFFFYSFPGTSDQIVVTGV